MSTERRRFGLRSDDLRDLRDKIEAVQTAGFAGLKPAAKEAAAAAFDLLAELVERQEALAREIARLGQAAGR